VAVTTPSAAQIRAEFDRIARLSHDDAREARYQTWLLRQVPHACEHALDIGCGTGSLARALATRARHVQAVDFSPAMIRVARERSATNANLEFIEGDFLEFGLPSKHFDCITAVATLHHMPWRPAIERAKELLRDGGRLLIIDLFEKEGLPDFVIAAVAKTIETMNYLGRTDSRELREAWNAHARGDAYLTLSEARRLCRETLPGARFRRHLFWRFSVVWTKASR
jgi:ubiquinone/menaquinone biosynthesis C-methylase UbiE